MARRQLEAENPTELRIALVGKTGAGKSACGNTILGRPVFVSTLTSSSVTAKCQKETEHVDGQPVAVVDTPGLFDTNREMDEVKREVAKAVCFAAPGPHVFLIVIRPNRFTEEEQETVKILQEMFGKEAKKFSMILFTHGDDLEAEETTIEKLIISSKPLCDFISQCDGGYHVFNNRDKKNRVQVSELLKKINTMVQRNGGSCFTNEMFQEVEKAIREKQSRLLRRNPDMDPFEARRRAEADNQYTRELNAALFTGAAAGAALGPVGALVGALVGTLVGASLVAPRACPIQ